MLVLVVDDDPALQLLSRAVLQRAGHKVQVASNGREAYAQAKSEVLPDLVLLDVMMPEVDGFGALELLKGDPTTSKIPVVMVSARVGIEDRLRALELGAVDFVPKPFQPDALTGFIENVLLLGEENLTQHRRKVLDDLRRSAGVKTETSVRAVPNDGALDVVADGVISMETDGTITGINRAAETVFGYLSTEIVGNDATSLLPELRTMSAERTMRTVIDLSDDLAHPSTLRGRRRDGTKVLLEACAVPLRGSVSGSLAVIVRDKQTNSFESVVEGARQQAVIADISQRAVEGRPIRVLMGDAVRAAAEVLEADYACVLQSSGDELEYRTTFGWDLDHLASTRIPMTSATVAGESILTAQPVLFDDLRRDQRFPESHNLHQLGVQSGISVPILGTSSGAGAIEVFSRTANRFCPNDVHFLKSIANVLASAIDREQLHTGMQALFQALPDATLVVDDRGRIQTANSAADSLFGYSVDELQRMTVEQLVPVEARQRHVKERHEYQHQRRVRPMGAAPSFRGLHRDGHEIPVDVMLSPMETAEGSMTVATIRDVTERQRLDAIRDAFLHAVSHELRTPLTAVLGFSELLTTSDVLENAHPEACEYVTQVRANAIRLERLLSDLLDLDRLSRGVVEPRRSPTDLKKLIVEAVGNLELNGRPVALDLTDDLSDVWLDAAKVERIVENLVANAAKHTPAGTAISVEASRTNEGVTIAVRDEGMGVPEELAGDVFQPFRRGNTASHAPGTGIGLSLVARFAEMHGGRAWLESKPGAGAAFLVQLPES